VAVPPKVTPLVAVLEKSDKPVDGPVVFVADTVAPSFKPVVDVAVGKENPVAAVEAAEDCCRDERPVEAEAAPPNENPVVAAGTDKDGATAAVAVAGFAPNENPPLELAAAGCCGVPKPLNPPVVPPNAGAVAATAAGAAPKEKPVAGLAADEFKEVDAANNPVAGALVLADGAAAPNENPVAAGVFDAGADPNVNPVGAVDATIGFATPVVAPNEKPPPVGAKGFGAAVAPKEKPDAAGVELLVDVAPPKANPPPAGFGAVWPKENPVPVPAAGVVVAV